MRTVLLLLFILCDLLFASAQDIPPATEQQVENQASIDQGATEDDSYLQEMEQFKKDPIDLNEAGIDQLKQLRILNELQIGSLISYRDLFGKLIDIYELQAVPGWDILIIRRLLPFVTIRLGLSPGEESRKRFRDGDHILLVRSSQALEKTPEFNNSLPGIKYSGSRLRILFRYRYTYKDLLQFGMTADKDAGESLFENGQKKGFDFYSFHVCVRKIGIVQSLVIGDFTVNMGQGLLQWQNLAFKKSANVLDVKRQASVVRPYSSSGEFYFHRGAGITIRKNKIEATAFISFRKLSANIITDTVHNEQFVSSILTSGYHRTVDEMNDRNDLLQRAFGAAVSYKTRRWHVAINGVGYHFSLPLQKRDEPYNLYAVAGNNWYNASVDYSSTYKNIHFFGEAAIDKHLQQAYINGTLISVDPRIDLSVVYRNIGVAYQAIGGNAFTENTYPNNERGLYMGISLRPAHGWTLNAYSDIYQFPWLKYRIDAPSQGRDILLQLTYTPNKRTEIYARYFVFPYRRDWRAQVSYKIDNNITFRNRVELMCYDCKGANTEKGFLVFADMVYKPLLKPFSGTIRLQYFETGGYDSRIYAYENDVLYSNSIPSFSDKGFRYYILLDHNMGKKISMWLRLSRTEYRNKSTANSTHDNKLTEITIQSRYIF